MRSTAATGGRLFGDAELNRLAAQVEVSNQNVAAAVAVVRAGAGARRASSARRCFPSLCALRRARGAPAARASSSGTGTGVDAGNSLSALRSARAGSPTSGAGSAARVESGAGQRAGERGRPRGGAAVGAGRARDRLLLAARGRRRARPAGATRSKATSARCRSRRTATTPASPPKTDVLQAQTQLATTRADLVDAARHARALRACDRGADRQGAGRLHARAGGRGRTVVPAVPLGVPSALLQRRPDIAVGRARRSRPRTRRSASSARPTSRA